MNLFSSPITFSITAEDHSVLEKAMGITEEASVLCIGSAGDTPLNLLSLNPQHIDVVDYSFPQLCEAMLKAEAMKNLTISEFHTLLGVIRVPQLALTYYDQIRVYLLPEVRSFWDKHRNIIRNGVLWQGSLQKMFACARQMLRVLIGRQGINNLKNLSTREDAEQFYQEYLCNWRATVLLKSIFNKITYKLFYPKIGFLHLPPGVSAYQFSMLKLKDILLSRPIANNPYLFPFIFGCYPSVECLPPYLHPVYYDTIRSRTSRLRFIHCDLSNYLQDAPECSIKCFALCNVMDWMGPDDLARLLEQVVRVAKSEARILIFSRSSARFDIPEPLRRFLSFDDKLCEQLKNEDRTGYHESVNILHVTK